jgi:transcriptional regulator with XRE-family HTH domain
MTGAALRQLRRQLGWTQTQLADAVGVTRNTVARWERDELGMRATAERLIQVIAAEHTLAKRAKGKPKTTKKGA